MTRLKITQTITAGLTDNNSELFADGDELKAVENGRVVGFREIDTKKISLIEAEMVRNKPALSILKKWCGTFDKMTEQYAWCNYGGFSPSPDIDITTLKTNREYWDCGLRDKCEGCGIVCKSIDVTKRETEVIRELATGSVDKQIISRLNITKNTLDTHKRNIYSKLGFTPKLR